MLKHQEPLANVRNVKIILLACTAIMFVKLLICPGTGWRFGSNLGLESFAAEMNFAGAKSFANAWRKSPKVMGEKPFDFRNYSAFQLLCQAAKRERKQHVDWD